MSLSEVSTPEAEPPPKHTVLDPEIYRQHGKVVDALTKRPVSSNTELAPLFISGEASGIEHGNIDVQLLLNLSGIAKPSVKARLELEDGTIFPPKEAEGAADYELYLTYNKLATAPCVRLECVFRNVKNEHTNKRHEMAIEFHFSPCGGDHLKNFERIGDTVQFEANGATLSGHSYMATRQQHLGEHEKNIIELFFKLSWYSPSWNLTFKLATNELTIRELRVLEQIYQRLPGGSGHELPSFTNPEYAAFGVDGDGVMVAASSMQRPRALMNHKVPNLMVPVESSDTFTSYEQAAIELRHAAHISNAEFNAALELWADQPHDGKLFQIDGFAVLAVNFRRYRKLGSIKDEVKHRLPRELVAKMYLPRKNEECYKFQGYHETEALDLPPHDAFFVVTSHSIYWLNTNLGMEIDGCYVPIKFEPHYNSFTHASQQETIGLLEHATQWHPHLLNQQCDLLDDVDLTAGFGIDPKKIAEADKWLFNCYDWSPEQRQVLKQVHKAKGRMVITLGVAGTGKTLLQSALATYFAKLGFKCLICPPANSNADHSAKLLRNFAQKFQKSEATDSKTNANANDNSNGHGDDADSAHFAASLQKDTPVEEDKIRVHRLYPSSRNIGLKDVSEEQARHHRVGHTDRAVSSIHGFEFKLRSSKDRKASVRDLSIEQGVVDEADKGVLHYKKVMESGHAPVDVWNKSRELLAESREGKFTHRDKARFLEYSKYYEACKGHLAALTHIMVTTTGNGRCSELLDRWMRAYLDYGIRYKGVIVFLDEAPKDVEVNTWMPIVMPREQTQGVFMFGDDKQLAPTNTCSKGKLNFNIYNNRLDIPLPLRLIREGFPYVVLREQQRMNPCISGFPNREFYAGKLRDGRKVKVKLSSVMLGLEEVLHGIIAKSFANKKNGDDYVRNATSDQARHHYLEVRGWVHVNEDSGSRVVNEHIDLFFKHVFPDLQAYFKSKTKENLTIICAYGWALGEYKDRFLKLHKEQELPDSWYPVVVEQQKQEGSANPTARRSTTSYKRRTTASQRGTGNKDQSTNREQAKTNTKSVDRAVFDPHVTTIDSAQGQESFMVVMDGSFQYRDWMGFLNDRGRCNVAMTRAKGVFWMIGGPLELRYHGHAGEPLSPFPKLKQEMEAKGRVHKFTL